MTRKKDKTKSGDRKKPQHNAAPRGQHAGAEPKPRTNKRKAAEQEHHPNSDEDVADEADFMSFAPNEDESDVEAEFEFFDPKPEDIDQISFFTDSALAAIPKLSTYEISEAISAQTRVGTTVRIGDEGDMVGLITCLSFATHGKTVLKALRNAAVNKAGLASKEDGELVESFFEEENGPLGVVITARFVNLPLQLLPPMQEALFSELNWAVEDEPTKELKDSFKFTRYMYVTEAYATGGGPKKKAKAPKKKKYRRKKKNKVEEEKPEEAEEEEDVADEVEYMYIKPEDEFFMKCAEKIVSWVIPGEETVAGGFTKRKYIIFFQPGRVDEFAQARKAYWNDIGFYGRSVERLVGY
mmetsp:Transcript_28547/g.71647  ORF Transcript_28547/g.71647 Transcript_28547/m.71647 type:complete len:354 (+) Transcript_28547:35-1096(+)